MIKKLCIISAIAVFALTFSMCNKKSTEPETPDVIGTWKYVLPSIIADSLSVNLTILNEEDYSLELLEGNEKKLFSSLGTWSFESDSIKLTGTECVVIDTTANPDTLMPLSETVCGTPIVIGTPDSPESWEITTSTLRVALSALIAEPMLSFAIQTLQILPLTRIK